MFRRRRSEADFAAEIQSHLDLEADDLRQEGVRSDEARYQAQRTFGNVRAAQERFYSKGRWIPLDRLLRDLRFGLRSLRESPGFAAAAILTLALGVGANTAVFSVMNAVLLRSLPVTDPERVVYLRTTRPPMGTGTIDDTGTFSYPVYQALRQPSGALGKSEALSDLIAVGALSTGKVNVRIGAQPEAAEADMVSGNFFSGLGVRILRGHGFTPRDEADHAQIAVISYDYWTRRFARDPGVLGTTLYVKGVPFTVAGIAAEGFEGVDPAQSTDFWIPLQNRIEFNILGNPPENGKLYQQDDTWWCLRLIGRLAPGVSRRQAITRLQPIFQRAARIGLGAPMPGERPVVLSFDDAKNFNGYEDQYGKPLHMLMAMVALVLLIALTNVVMLLMARNAARQREFSLRLALGARPVELLRQLLTESVLLVLLGGALAWVFAEVATRILARWALIESSLAPDRTVLLFTCVILALTALVCGIAPFRVAIAGGAELALKTSAATAHTDAGKSRTGKTIVALQMALCVVLLVGAGLLTRTLANLRNIPLGINTTGLVVFGLDPQSVHNEAQLVRFYQDLQLRLRRLPGVESTAVSSNRLGSYWSNNSDVKIDGKEGTAPDGHIVTVRSNDIGPDFFHTLQVPILMGREFTDADAASKNLVTVVNQLFAETFFPHQSPLGHKVNGMTIIGVVANHKYRSMTEDPIPMAWWDYQEAPDEGGMTVEMRVHQTDPLAILPAVQKIVAQMDPNAPLMQPTLQREQFERTISQQLMFARLAEFFGILAVVLVATGLYGTLSYRVNRRTAEIGVRMAVGARRGQVVWMVLRDSLVLTAIGVVVGVPIAILTGRALGSALYGVQPFDPTSYAFALIGVAAVAVAAAAMPAARAASINPLKALRTE
ncbi:MAG TPA: ABC transporter permease [Acidobacteriaceae bacterium]|jgi:predicted permease|nr:ABC transporter permease [Acidobacteriaceae bacterium]